MYCDIRSGDYTLPVTLDPTPTPDASREDVAFSRSGVPPPPNRLSNGAPRFVDSAVPLPLELAALEAVA